MKRIGFLNSALVCFLFMCTVSYNEENLIAEENLPTVVKEAFINRDPETEITASRNYSDWLSSNKYWQIEFIDNRQNPAKAWYLPDGTCKMTHAKLKNMDRLSDKAQYSFRKSKYGAAQIKEIYKTERAGMEKSLYALYYLFSTKMANNAVHYAFLNDDGSFLARLTSIPNVPPLLSSFRKVILENTRARK